MFSEEKLKIQFSQVHKCLNNYDHQKMCEK